jgi:hypothetical protein
MTKSMKSRMDNMFGVKRVNGEYVPKNEYNDRRRKRHDEILDGWIEKQENFEDRQTRLWKIDPFDLSEGLKNVDSRFCTLVEKFANKYINGISIKKSLKDETAIFDNRLSISCAGRNIVRNFILERSSFLIRSNVLYIPKCENENDVIRWFEDNCNNLCLGIAIHRNGHSKFHIKGHGSYGGIDHICIFVDGISGNSEFHHCEDNNYQPLLNRYMSKKQVTIYNQFYELVEADFMLIELEYLSSNFVKHKHPSVVDMVICYRKDRDLSVPVLELGMDRDTND